MNRAEALALMHEYTPSDALRKHMYAVEAAMRAYARKLGDSDVVAFKNMLRPVLGRKYSEGIVEEARKWVVTAVACWSCPIACCYRSDVSTGPHRGCAATLGGGAENQHRQTADVFSYRNAGNINT